MLKDTLVIVGGGPVGLTAALQLRSLFRKVIVLEKQSKEKILMEKGHVFPMYFNVPAAHVLKEIDAWETIKSCDSVPYSSSVLDIKIPLVGFKMELKSKLPIDTVNWRSDIVKALHQCVAKQANITITFDAKLQGIDFENKVCGVDAHGKIKFDLLIGADGANSQVRGLLAEHHPSFSASQFHAKELLEWCSVISPYTPSMQERYVDVLRVNMAYREVCTSTDMKVGINQVMFYKIGTPSKKVVELFQRELKGMGVEGSLIDSLVKNKSWSGLSKHVSAPAYSRGSVVLMGDSAHCFLSAGDAVSLGVVTVGELYRILLESKDGDLDKACSYYDKTVGASCREYSLYASRRASVSPSFVLEKLFFGMGYKCGLTPVHPFSAMLEVSKDFSFQKVMNGYVQTKKIDFWFLELSAVLLLALVLVNFR